MRDSLKSYRRILNQPCLDAALAYADRGWRVLPVLPSAPNASQQTPIGGLEIIDATQNPETIRTYWNWMPHANIGIVTGRLSGLLVLEAFPEGGGLESLDLLREEYGLYPRTLRASNCRGHIQEYYSYPQDVVIPSQTWLRKGLNLNSEENWIVAPPSIDPSGCRYEWELAGRHELPDVQPFPEQLLPEVLATNHKK